VVREHSSSVMMFVGPGVGLMEATNRKHEQHGAFNSLGLKPEEEITAAGVGT
jgi:hypothetical protein